MLQTQFGHTEFLEYDDSGHFAVWLADGVNDIDGDGKLNILRMLEKRHDNFLYSLLCFCSAFTSQPSIYLYM